MGAPLLTLRVETSVSPPIEVTSRELLEAKDAGEPPSLLLRLLRPRVQLSGLVSKTIAPAGAPFPWPLGLAVVLLVLLGVGAGLAALLRRIL